MSNQSISHWLLAMINEESMSNWSPKILWPIDYSSMTSITHWCNRLLIDYYTANERHFSCFLVPFLQNWTTLTEQPSRYGSITNGKEILENLLKLNFHILLKLKKEQTWKHLFTFKFFLILFFFAKYVCSHEMISMSYGWNQWLINAIND